MIGGEWRPQSDREQSLNAFSSEEIGQGWGASNEPYLMQWLVLLRFYSFEDYLEILTLEALFQSVHLQGKSMDSESLRPVVSTA